MGKRNMYAEDSKQANLYNGDFNQTSRPFLNVV